MAEKAVHGVLRRVLTMRTRTGNTPNPMLKRWIDVTPAFFRKKHGQRTIVEICHRTVLADASEKDL